MAGPGARLQNRRIEDQGTAGSGPAEARGPFRCESLSRGSAGFGSRAARRPGAKHRSMAAKRKAVMTQSRVEAGERTDAERSCHELHRAALRQQPISLRGSLRAQRLRGETEFELTAKTRRARRVR